MHCCIHGFAIPRDLLLARKRPQQLEEMERCLNLNINGIGAGGGLQFGKMEKKTQTILIAGIF